MLETQQLVSGADPEVALYDGIAFYESGEIYKALICWKELLKLSPEHEVAQRYIEFVQGYLGIGDQFSEHEISSAQRRESNKLRGEDSSSSSAQAQMPADDDFDPNMLQAPAGAIASVVTPAPSVEPPPPPESIRIRGGAQATMGTHMAAGLIPNADESAEDLIVEEVVTKKPEEELPVTLLASSVEQMADSPVAQQAVRGEAGPRTQADGLTVQALSRQLADFHRSGKYEQAVETAKKLLLQDPQHAVARRYIDEYHRQKQAALQAAKRKQAQQAQESVKAKPSVTSTQLGSPSAQTIEPEDAPTVAPANSPVADEPEAHEAIIKDYAQKPKIKMKSDQISWQAFDHRAGFFMSQVDGNTSYEDLIVISAMPREEAVKILEQLVSNGVIG